MILATKAGILCSIVFNTEHPNKIENGVQTYHIYGCNRLRVKRNHLSSSQK